MITVIGVRFKQVGKIYYFDCGDMHIELDDKVVAETERGVECGRVVVMPKSIDENDLDPTPKKIIRKATKGDLSKLEENKRKEKHALEVCEKKIKEHNLDMKLISTEYTLDGSKLLFYFTADGRIDFRMLVKDLAAIFKTRIELRQIGVRDESRLLGGLGVCGREFCCSSFLSEFQPVSIKMAKEQGLSLSPNKISGTCGRLLCCLKYEQEAYSDLLKKTPKIGAIVTTPEGKGRVVDQNILTGKLLISLDKSKDAAPIKFDVSDVKLIKDGKIKLKKEEIENLKNLE